MAGTIIDIRDADVDRYTDLPPSWNSSATGGRQTTGKVSILNLHLLDGERRDGIRDVVPKSRLRELHQGGDMEDNVKKVREEVMVQGDRGNCGSLLIVSSLSLRTKDKDKWK